MFSLILFHLCGKVRERDFTQGAPHHLIQQIKGRCPQSLFNIRSALGNGFLCIFE